MTADVAAPRRERPSFCTNYRGMDKNDTCHAGVPYSTFESVTWDHRPCFLKGGKPTDGAVTCQHLLLPTPEGLQAWRDRLDELRRKHEAIGPDVLAFRQANKRRSAQQTVPCKACGTGQLTMWIAGYNGHVGGRCSTKGCVAWQQ